MVMFKLLPLCQMPTIAAPDESEIHGVGELPVPPYVFAWQKKEKNAKPVKEGADREVETSTKVGNWVP